MSRSLSQFDAKQTSSEDCSPIVWAYIEMIIWRFAIQFGERRRQSKKRKEKMKLENINLKELRSENLPKFDNCPCELCDDGCFDRNKLEHNPSCKRKLIVKKSETFSKLRKCPLTHYQMTFKSFLDPTGKGEDHRRELCPPPADNEIPISFANHPMSGLTAQREHFQAPRPTGVVKPAKPSVRKTEQNSIELGFLLSRTIWFWIELRQCKLRLNTRPNSSRNQWQKSNSKNYRIQTTNQSFLFVFCVFFFLFSIRFVSVWKSQIRPEPFRQKRQLDRISNLGNLRRLILSLRCRRSPVRFLFSLLSFIVFLSTSERYDNADNDFFLNFKSIRKKKQPIETED